MRKKHQQNGRSNRGWARKAFVAALLAGSSLCNHAAAQFGGQASVNQQSSTTMQLPLLPGQPASDVPVQRRKATVEMVQQPAAQQLTVAPGQTATLQKYTLPPNLIGTIAAQLEVAHHSNPAVRVTTEPSTGALMVMAPAAIQQQIASQLQTLVQQNQITAAEAIGSHQTNYQLHNLSWQELEDALTRLGGSKLTVTTDRNGEIANLNIANARGTYDVLQIDRRRNVVTMIGSGEEINGWSQIVQTLDIGQADRVNATHVVPLAPAAPRKVRQAFQLVKATIAQEQGGNAEAEVDLSGQATAMGTLDDLGPGTGLFGDVQIEFVEEIDLVIIRGSKEDVRRTLEVIERIKEQAEKTQPEIVVYPLKHANGVQVETLITELYEEVYAARQGNISISALGQPNALLLIGRAEVVKTVEELIKKIDVPLAPEDQLEVIPLKHASAVDLEERVRNFFTSDGAGGEPRPGLATQALILGDYRTNSLIVQASPREMIEIKKLVSSLDVEAGTAQNDVRVFRLKNALAEDLIDVLNEVIGGQSTADDGSQATPPSGKLSFVNVDGGRVESGILAGVVISADSGNNQLVVRAPAQSMQLIETLIEELDQTPGAEARIKVFQLTNADATLMAQTLQGLFGLQVTAGQTAQSNFLNNATRNNVSTGGESSLIQLQIAPEARTNSLVVSGSPSDLQVVEALIIRLDEDIIESRTSDVVWLRNATAEDVATALNSYFGGLTQGLGQLNGGGQLTQAISPVQLFQQQVYVVPETLTNSLLISADAGNFEEAMRLIERLDRRPPLIAIQVLIAEVQLDDQFEFGTEWGIQDGLLFDRQASTGGTLTSPVFNVGGALTGPSGGPGLTQNVAGQALSSFGVGRGSAGGPGGVVLSASSEAIGVLLRALQTANRAQILNRPMITTLDNQPATTQIGQLVPRIESVSQATGINPGQIITNDANVGLILEVQPRVNQDGLILMNIFVDNSSIGDPDTGIPVGFGVNGEVIRSPIINTTNARTVISAYSGQTVVFGGLISKTRSSSRSQVPILGSLPLIGPAFRFDVESEQRRELLVILTPRIISDDEDYELIKDVESSRMSWCLSDVLNTHGDVGLSGGNGLWGPAKSATIYPDMQPAVIEDRALPRSGAPAYGQPMLGPQFQPGETIIEAPGIEPIPTPMLEGANAAPATSQFQQVSFPTVPRQQ